LELAVALEFGHFASRAIANPHAARREIFYHKGPFLRRKDVSLEAGFREPRLPRDATNRSVHRGRFSI
jgi:hypothetical protein